MLGFVACDMCVNSSTMDEGAQLKQVPYKLMTDSFQRNLFIRRGRLHHGP